MVLLHSCINKSYRPFKFCCEPRGYILTGCCGFPCILGAEVPLHKRIFLCPVDSLVPVKEHVAGSLRKIVDIKRKDEYFCIPENMAEITLGTQEFCAYAGGSCWAVYQKLIDIITQRMLGFFITIDNDICLLPFLLPRIEMGMQFSIDASPNVGFQLANSSQEHRASLYFPACKDNGKLFKNIGFPFFDMDGDFVGKLLPVDPWFNLVIFERRGDKLPGGCFRNTNSAFTCFHLKIHECFASFDSFEMKVFECFARKIPPVANVTVKPGENSYWSGKIFWRDFNKHITQVIIVHEDQADGLERYDFSLGVFKGSSAMESAFSQIKNLLMKDGFAGRVAEFLPLDPDRNICPHRTFDKFFNSGFRLVVNPADIHTSTMSVRQFFKASPNIKVAVPNGQQ